MIQVMVIHPAQVFRHHRELLDSLDNLSVLKFQQLLVFLKVQVQLGIQLLLYNQRILVVLLVLLDRL